MDRETSNDNFQIEDLKVCAKTAGVKRGRMQTILQEVTNSVRKWPEFAQQAEVQQDWIKRIQKTHRTELLD